MGNYFVKNLIFLRKSKGLSQVKLGELVGVNQTTIARWEKKEMSPSIDNVEDVAKALNVSLPDLLIKDLETNEEKKLIKNENHYKQLLKDKGLMDDKENIKEEDFDKLMKIADMIQNLDKKEDQK